jgi:PAS domain S-box-containing protein
LRQRPGIANLPIDIGGGAAAMSGGCSEDHFLSHGRASLFTVPSSDLAFSEFVRRISAQLPDASPSELQARLRGLFPSVLVRPRGLSSDDHTWYVYREGRWVDGKGGDWWSDESMPRMDIDRDGFIAAANAAAGEAFGIAPNRLVHRHFTDFAVPGTSADMMLMREIMLAVGQAGATFRHIRADGEVRVAEYHSVASESGSTVTIRPIGPMSVATPPRPALHIETRPAADGLFATVVDGIVARMPEPTLAGLQLRLRRSYPYATVESMESARWRVARDPRAAPATVDWQDPKLARTIALDTSLIVEANEAALELLGPDLVGRHWQELALPSSLDQRLEMRDYYLANGGAESTFRLVGAGGELVDYDYRLSWEGDHFTTVMSPFALDERPGEPVARVILNPDGTIATANEAAQRLYGASLAELQAAPPGAFSANTQSPEAQAALREAWESQGQPDLVGETTLRALDGTQRRVAFGITRLGDGRYAAILRPLEAPVENELKVFTAGQVLAKWRAAERELEAIEPESPEAVSIKGEIDRFRAAYQQLFDAARQTT